MKQGSAVHTKRNPLVKKLNLSTKNHKPSREKKNFPGSFQTPNVFRPQDDETTALGFLLRNRLHRTRKNAGPRVVVMPSLPAMEGDAYINVLPPTHDEDRDQDEEVDPVDDAQDIVIASFACGAVLLGIGYVAYNYWKGLPRSNDYLNDNLYF